MFCECNVDSQESPYYASGSGQDVDRDGDSPHSGSGSGSDKDVDSERTQDGEYFVRSQNGGYSVRTQDGGSFVRSQDDSEKSQDGNSERRGVEMKVKSINFFFFK